jgi:hypothetical protein
VGQTIVVDTVSLVGTMLSPVDKMVSVGMMLSLVGMMLSVGMMLLSVVMHWCGQTATASVVWVVLETVVRVVVLPLTCF